MIHISLERTPCCELIENPQELAQKNKGNLTIPLDIQMEKNLPSAALPIVEDRRRNRTERRFRIRCHWFQKPGHMKHEFNRKKAGKPKVLPKVNDNVSQEEDKQFSFLERKNSLPTNKED